MSILLLQVQRVYLTDTLKRDFSSVGSRDVPEQGLNNNEPYEIPGDIFSIAYKNILNINIHFIAIDNSLEEIQELPDGESSNN